LELEVGFEIAGTGRTVFVAVQQARGVPIGVGCGFDVCLADRFNLRFNVLYSAVGGG